MFVLVLIDALSQQSAETVAEIFNQKFKKIKEHYILFVRKKGRKELLTKDLIDFFSTLPVPLGKIKIFKKVIFNAI
jgi:hypothetical protein